MSSSQQLLLGEGAGGAAPVYIEDVFSTWLYTGTGSALTITNNIDLSTKGGLVWVKNRAIAENHHLVDTVRGGNKAVFSNTTSAEGTSANYITSFNTTGFTLGSSGGMNDNGTAICSWTFRDQPKFFDVVTGTTGSGTNFRIAHNLDSVPGCIFFKRTDGASDWVVWHRSLASATNSSLNLNLFGATTTRTNTWGTSGPTSADFGIDTTYFGSGINYVAYLFAHNAGGFGLTGTDNVISCGSFNTDGSGDATVSLGYEPQWLLVKKSSSTGDWTLFDSMRGIPTNGDDKRLFPNLPDAENGSSDYLTINATGFSIVNNGFGALVTCVYIAIRRGPMKVPTSGTSVLGLNARNGNGSNTTVTGGAGVTDFSIIKNRGAATNWVFASRLTGNRYLSSNLTAAEVSANTAILQPNPWDVMDGVKVGTGSSLTNQTENTYINYLFDRAPSVFDEVCYTGTGSATTFAHNLGVVPEMMIVKRRNTTGEWRVYVSSIGANDSLKLQTNEIPQGGSAFWDSTTPTASVFTVGTSADTNASGSTYINRLFATCAGVSKVGSYTGNDTTQTINCGFTTGARFVLVKRTDNTGNWATSDTARGMVSGTNPALRVNLTNAESAADFFVTTSVGFQIVSSDPTVNADGGTYIFLAIA